MPANSKPVVAIGVTGHRFLMETDKIGRAIDMALDRIGQAFPGRSMTLISPIAEGADRLVAERALARPGTRLVVPLPLPRDEYLVDFASPESKEEFMHLLARADEVVKLPPAPTRNAAYEAAGCYVLGHCDVLIAIWNGQGTRVRGGTGGIVAEARRRSLPLAWIHAGNCKPGTAAPTSLFAEQGVVTFENF